MTKAYDEELLAGQIVEQSVRAKDDAPFRSEIDVVVSRGPEPQPVPRVTGRTQEEATTLLQGAGFLVVVEEEFSDDVSRGRVISQRPEKGTELQPGNTVTIVVSKGPPEFPMPDVVGMTKDAAVARLTSLGLQVDVVLVKPDGSKVVFQEPAVGATVHAGDVVHIYVA